MTEDHAYWIAKKIYPCLHKEKTMSAKLEEQPLKSKDLLSQIDTLNALGWDHCEREEYDTALETGQKAYTLSETAGHNDCPYQKGVAESLVLLGTVHLKLGKISQCIPEFLNAITILEEMPRSAHLADALSGIAWCEFNIGNFSEAQSYITRALNIAESLQDLRRQIHFRNTFGAVLDGIGNFELAIDVLNRALKIAERDEELTESEKAITLNNLAIAYRENGRYQEGLQFALQSLPLVQKQKKKSLESAVQDTIGQIYLSLKDYEKAIIHFKKAIELANQIGAQDMNDESLVNLGKTYYEMGRTDLAIQYSLAAEEIFKRSNNSRIAYHCHELLSTLYEEKGELEKSFYHYKQFHTIKESVFNHQSLQKITDMASIHRIETAQKDAEILRLKNIALQQEIISQKVIQSELEKLATMDTLTKLFNRRYFFHIAREKIDYARKNQKPLHLLMIDIDLFKRFNDQYGHIAGDHLISSIAQTLQNNIRPDDLCCRYGGDEFVILLPDMTETACIQVAERLRHLIGETTIQSTDNNGPITVSIGIAKSDILDLSIEDFVNKADLALYRAKRLGGNCVSS